MKKSFTNKLKAFTLIELLVVIAIIGILSAIVIVNLNSARNKSQDTAIKAQASQLKNTAAIYYDDNNYAYSIASVASAFTAACPTSASGAFAGTFFTNSESLKAIAGLTSNSGFSSQCAIGYSPNIGSQSWALSTRLRNPNSAGSVVYWCVDSSGAAKQISSHISITGSVEAVCP